MVSARASAEPHAGVRLSSGVPGPAGTPLEVALADEPEAADQTIEAGAPRCSWRRALPSSLTTRSSMRPSRPTACASPSLSRERTLRARAGSPPSTAPSRRPRRRAVTALRRIVATARETCVPHLRESRGDDWCGLACAALETVAPPAGLFVARSSPRALGGDVRRSPGTRGPDGDPDEVSLVRRRDAVREAVEREPTWSRQRPLEITSRVRVRGPSAR
jgi:hypothetical protein